ncbi:S-layer homology domain-containing protein [Brevibacillus massiliensis]|uniref:S-layer homology domain-containing protein n=2 Tax=Brevibacillus massiliensis TaxID=1118054 RepID=UPI0002EFCE76|nr:S-layer homology domain-containing protein [Brevibacillus massiliensis]
MKATGRIMALVLAAFCLADTTSKAAAVNPFDDISGSFAKQQITDLYIRGIVEGNGDRKFQPKQPVTRSEFVKMLGKLIKIQPQTGTVPLFTDVSKQAWYYPWVQTAAELGLARGTGASSFSPNAPISRQEAAVMLVRILEGEQSGSKKLSYSDASKVADWAKPYVAEITRLKYMQGAEGKFRPADPLSREETAVVLDKLAVQADKSGQMSKVQPSIQLGWEYGGTDAEFQQRVGRSGVAVNKLSPRWYYFDASGNFSDWTTASLVSWAHQKGKQVWPLVGNRFNRELTHSMLATSANRTKMVNQLVGFVDKYKLDGLNLDFENVDPADRDNFTAFVKELASALSSHQAKLSVDVPPDLGSDWSEPFDFAALGKYADYVVLMGYDEHWTGGPEAGSVSSLPWLKNAIRELKASIPAYKLIVAVPFLNRDWYMKDGTLTSTDLTLEEQQAVLKTKKPAIYWDETTSQYVATYWEGSEKHTIWLEETRSFTKLYQMILAEGASGIAYWHIGAENDEMWTAIQNVIRTQNFRSLAR